MNRFGVETRKKIVFCSRKQFLEISIFFSFISLSCRDRLQSLGATVDRRVASRPPPPSDVADHRRWQSMGYVAAISGDRRWPMMAGGDRRWLAAIGNWRFVNKNTNE